MTNYITWKTDFIRKSKGLEKTETSPMNEYGGYTKWYFLGNGDILVEENSPAWRLVEVTETMNGEIIGKHTETVKFLRTEAYSSKTKTVIFYEKW